jgi:predicted nuclease with TOPRIM domain
MKIQRFNEKLTPQNRQFIEDFENNCDDGTIEWIISVAKQTKVPQYSNPYSKKFQEDKNIKSAEKFLDAEKELNRLQGEMNKIQNNMNDLELELANELLYKFQEDLLKYDFDKFYEFFIEDLADENYIYGDSHLDIIKKYQKDLDALISAKQYNL